MLVCATVVSGSGWFQKEGDPFVARAVELRGVRDEVRKELGEVGEM